ncbi:hypothetical protein FQA39_LY15147 [Lamprigera yunnana]|nr:hypothetical protein FQA39_LY15147 [Lamprigera yunnana]
MLTLSLMQVTGEDRNIETSCIVFYVLLCKNISSKKLLLYYVVECPNEKENGITPLSIVSHKWISGPHECFWSVSIISDKQKIILRSNTNQISILDIHFINMIPSISVPRNGIISSHTNEMREVSSFSIPTSSSHLSSYFFNEHIGKNERVAAHFQETRRPQNLLNDKIVSDENFSKISTIEKDVKVIKQLTKADGSTACSALHDRELFVMLLAKTVQELENLNEKLLQQNALN